MLENTENNTETKYNPEKGKQRKTKLPGLVASYDTRPGKEMVIL